MTRAKTSGAGGSTAKPAISPAPLTPQNAATAAPAIAGAPVPETSPETAPGTSSETSSRRARVGVLPVVTSAAGCPSWCTRKDAHTVHVRHAGRVGRVWVATVHEDQWLATQVMVACTAPAARSSSSVSLHLWNAADLAEVFRQLGNAEVAALIDDAVAAAGGVRP